jgi:hypothetical protein
VVCRIPRRAAGIVLVTALLAGCAPSFTYVADLADQAYFKVPPGWTQLSQRSLSQAQATAFGRSLAGPAGGPLTWSRAYDAARQPSVTHIFSRATAPVVYASVQDVSAAVRANISFNSMRDLLLPVTPAARSQAAAAGSQLTGFHLFADRVITGNNTRGINEIFGYDLGGVPEVFDQTVLTNSATTKLYLLLVQCDLSCFAAHRQQIATVVNSFTVRGS